MPDIILNALFFGFMILMAWLETVRRKSRARELATKWLQENDLSLPNQSNMKINAFVWPVRVNVLAHDKTGERLSIVLRAGEFFGGIFAGTIKCESRQSAGKQDG
ncbi:MAG: hypothetical protein IPL72_16840 [Sulfuritalea sp.]|nr:hypothetical protein [Sulfuritalea sp.]